MMYRMQYAQRSALFASQYSIRMIHPRGYTNPEDHATMHFNEASMALMGAKNTRNLVFVCKKYEKYMTDKQIMYAFNMVAQHKLDKIPEFWSYMVPLVKEQLKGLDRQTVPSLCKAVEAAAFMRL